MQRRGKVKGCIGRKGGESGVNLSRDGVREKQGTIGCSGLHIFDNLNE